MNLIGILISVALVAGLLLAMAKMSDHGSNPNGCGGSCSSCGIPEDRRSCISGINDLDPDNIRK